MVQIGVAPPNNAPEFICFKGVVIEDSQPVPHAKLLPRSRLQELDIHPAGVLFVFELSEVEVLCTKDQSEEILEHIVDRRLSSVEADENPGIFIPGSSRHGAAPSDFAMSANTT